MATSAILSNRWVRASIAAFLFIITTETVPRWWCGREGNRWFDGDAALTTSLAREVASTVQREVTTDEFTSSSSLFRHEWQYGTYQMSALGLLQVCHEHPELRAEFLPVIDRAIDKLLSPEMRRFDRQSWGEDPLDSLDGGKGHAAYLGYLNLALALHRRWVPNSRFIELNEKISSALIRRFQASPTRILQTYPNEAYPVDTAAGLASVLLYEIKSADERAAIASVLECYRTTWRAPGSGLLYQALDARNGCPLDTARASGTALAAYFLSFAERDVSRQLFESVHKHLAGSVGGFGYVKEYADDSPGQPGDIDSGPVVFGISTSGTGFTLASSRVFRDRALFVSLARTAYLVGTPVSHGGREFFVTGGPLGNAIMLAMLTAQSTTP